MCYFNFLFFLFYSINFFMRTKCRLQHRTFGLYVCVCGCVCTVFLLIFFLHTGDKEWIPRLSGGFVSGYVVVFINSITLLLLLLLTLKFINPLLSAERSRLKTKLDLTVISLHPYFKSGCCCQFCGSSSVPPGSRHLWYLK